MWESRCYSDGIPDGEDVPKALSDNHRVPSWKKIAICILNNDHQLRGLGFSKEDSDLVLKLKEMKKEEDSPQIKLL
tara:strand:- start:4673 stop:4900 length:228 start_codon:yes stop_codon:yes gene_type:complete